MIDFPPEYRPLQGVNFIDLFCGIGGFHLALSSFGANCVFACDIDTAAKNVYQGNFGMMPHGDITQIKEEEIPEHDIICAGFPCQPFSISGSQQGFNDEKGRGKLFFDIIRIARYHRPKVLILENVKNFEKHDKGRTILKVYQELNAIGYSVFSKVLCSSDFGVPQKRNRIYIVAFRQDINVLQFDFPAPIDTFKTLKDIRVLAKDNKIKGKYIVERTCTINTDVKVRSRDLIRIGKIGLGRQGERIYSLNGQATTLSSQGGGLGGKTGMYLIQNKVRKLYPRECARLMGFPDDFILADTQETNYKQFGNSVVVDVLQYIVKEIVKKLEDAENEEY